MNAVAIGLFIGIGLLFLIIQIIIARGTYSFAKTTAEPEVVARQTKFLKWFLMIGFAAWFVALAIIPAKLDVAVVGAATLLIFGGLFSLPLLARLGRISQRVYVVCRVLLVPVVAGLLILVSEIRDR